MAGFKSVQDQDDFVMRDLSRSLAALLGYLEKHRTTYSSDIDKLSSKVRTDIRKVKLRVKNLKNSERRLTRRTESLRNELACIDNYTKIKRKIRHELRQELDNSRRSQRLIPQTRIKRDQLRRDMERQAERNTQLTRQNEEATVIILSQVHEVSRLQEEIFGLKVNLKDLKAFSDANMTEIHYRYKLLTNRLLKEKDDQLCKMQLIVSKLRETQANCGGRLQCTALQCYEGEIGRHALNTKEELMTEKQGLEADLRRRDRKLKENDDKMNELNKFISSLNMKIKSSEKDMEQRDRKIKEQEDIINSIKHEMIQINNRNKDLEHTLKKDNEQLLQKSTQLNQKIQTESEMSRTITSLKRKTQCLSQELLDSIKEKDRQQHALNQLHDKEAEFKRTFISLNTSIQHLEKEVDDRDIRIKHLKDMLDNKKIEIPNANELELNTQLKERDDQLSELSIQLQHTLEQMQETETAFDARVTSQRKKIQHLESELDQCILTINCKTVQMTEMSKVNKHLEKNVKENDGIIRKQGDQLNCTLNRLQEIETEFVGTNISLKKKEQELERLDQKVKDLEETLAKMRTEINGGNEHLLNQVKEKDKQLSDLSDQLHEAFEQLHENDIKQGETITSLKQENVHLVARVNSSEMQVYTLEKMLDNTISEITDINERSANNAANENDDQISDMKVQLDLTLKSMHDKESDLNGLITTLKKKSREKDDQMLELSDQLTRTLNQLHDKETEMRQNDIALQKKQKYIEEEVDDNKWKIKHLEELLNRKENEMTQIIHKNKLLEKKLMENYKSISERDQTLKNLDLTVKELEKIINNRDLTVKDLEEKLQKMRTEIRDGSDSLVIELKDKDQQLSKQAARLQQILNQLHEKESELGGTISLLKRQIQGKDDHISELKQALKLLGDREFEMKEIDTSLRTKLDYLEKELERREREVEKHLEDILNSKTAEITKMSAQNEYLENKVKEKDELIDQRDRVLKEQQEAKTELCGIITSLQKKNEDLGTDINDRDLTVKDLEKRLERMRMEISGGNERLILAMTEKDKQISKQAAKLQHALNKLHETEAELGGIITSLKKQIQGKDDQISKLGDQLKQTLKLLDDKESEVKEIDATLRKKIEYLQEELERRERKAETHLQEMLNRKTAEITKMRAETDLLEIKLKENDKQSDQRDRILRRLQKAETESSKIINSLQEKNYGLDTDIKGRDKKVKDLEEKKCKNED